ncbi:hypothetical protein B296_00018133 [Ensete ventricosum]|uniref:Uncharacterized protein n=1 Tax=Ensete ventricosum TaxID=4639 RepID=A0A426ZQ74_ENSVE|nr:hypothetical protein B296_00018133 [Ensete ventricosum]
MILELFGDSDYEGWSLRATSMAVIAAAWSSNSVLLAKEEVEGRAEAGCLYAMASIGYEAAGAEEPEAEEELVLVEEGQYLLQRLLPSVPIGPELLAPMVKPLSNLLILFILLVCLTIEGRQISNRAFRLPQLCFYRNRRYRLDQPRFSCGRSSTSLTAEIHYCSFSSCDCYPLVVGRSLGGGHPCQAIATLVSLLPLCHQPLLQNLTVVALQEAIETYLVGLFEDHQNRFPIIRPLSIISRCSTLPPSREPTTVVSRCFPIVVALLPIVRPHVATCDPTSCVTSVLAGPLLFVAKSDLWPIAPSPR